MTAFTVSIYSCVYRPYVPFKSPAGETSECVAPDRGIRAIAEKVRRPMQSCSSRVSSISRVLGKSHLCATRIHGWLSARNCWRNGLKRMLQCHANIGMVKCVLLGGMRVKISCQEPDNHQQ